MKFTCKDVQNRWSEYLYRELDERELNLFIRHLLECEFCRAEEARWKDLLTRLDGLGASEGIFDAPPELLATVKREIILEEEESPRKTFSRLAGWVAGAACVFALVTGGIVTGFEQLQHSVQSKKAKKPVEESVLSNIYNDETLQIYREEGILLEPTPKKNTKCADR